MKFIKIVLILLVAVWALSARMCYKWGTEFVYLYGSNIKGASSGAIGGAIGFGIICGASMLGFCFLLKEYIRLGESK